MSFPLYPAIVRIRLFRAAPPENVDPNDRRPAMPPTTLFERTDWRVPPGLVPGPGNPGLPARSAINGYGIQSANWVTEAPAQAHLYPPDFFQGHYVIDCGVESWRRGTGTFEERADKLERQGWVRR